MASTSANPDHPNGSLPQYGFGQIVDFESLVANNHFLFRVYTPKESSPFADDSEPFFVAPKFDQRYARSPADIQAYRDHRSHIGTYDDVVRHMDWTTKASSTYISTSFSFIWSIWEALKRYHSGIKKDVQIAVIDASALSGRAVTAVQLLRDSVPSERRSEHWKWYRFAQESQSVLVYESIPASAVLTSIPLISLLEKLPSYFLRQNPSEFRKDSVLSSVGWDYTEKKLSFRRFSQEMSARFLQLSPEVRLQDTTAGSVRLALAFLRPWFHQTIVEDFQTATVTLCALSFSIARWPGQWWAQEHAELWDLIHAMVLSIAEEIRVTQRERDSKEVSRLQGVIDELDDVVQKYKGEITSRRKSAQKLKPLLIPSPHRPVTAHPSPTPFIPSLGVSRMGPQQAIVTPLTPPTSPISPKAPSFSDQSLGPQTPTSATSTSWTLLSVDDRFPGSFSPEMSISSPKSTSLASPTAEHDPIDPVLSLVDPLSVPLPPSPTESSTSTLLSEPSTPLPSSPELLNPPAAPEVPSDLPSLPEQLVVTQEPLLLPTPEPLPRRENLRKLPTLAETASCLVTGFLIGAFITLCLLSPHRRTMLTHLT